MRLKNIIDKLAAPFQGRRPGLALAVIRAGETIAAEAFGCADLAAGLPCALDTNFRLASLTKPFTAMAILILAERGALALDDPLSRFLPLRTSATLRQFLNHTSGVLDYEELVPSGAAIPLRDRDVLALLQAHPGAYFAPGAQFRYSNSGYALLALVVEKVSGVSFAAFLRAQIFQPLGMSHTVAYEAGVSNIARRSLGYTMTPEEAVETDQDLTSSVLGDGGIYSSITDLRKWDEALYTGKLVSPSSLRQAFSPGPLETDFPGSGYGFGWYLTTRRGFACQWHYGSTCGFSSWLERVPDERFCIILLANRRDAQLPEIARALQEAW